MNSLADIRVLVVEDEPLIAMHVEDLLVGLGCRIAGVASSNPQALAIIDSTPIDVAVLDINLGSGETSYMTADTLADRSVPFILLSGYSSASRRPRDEVRPWLQKPVDEAELSRALLFALETRHGTKPPE